MIEELSETILQQKVNYIYLDYKYIFLKKDNIFDFFVIFIIIIKATRVYLKAM